LWPNNGSNKQSQHLLIIEKGFMANNGSNKQCQNLLIIEKGFVANNDSNKQNDPLKNKTTV